MCLFRITSGVHTICTSGIPAVCKDVIQLRKTCIFTARNLVNSNQNGFFCIETYGILTNIGIYL
jgi:hypothetical protein